MKTVKVKIAVAVDTEGEWCSAGWTNCSDDELISTAIEHVGENEAIYWVIAELKVPEKKKPVEIKASEIIEVR